MRLLVVAASGTEPSLAAIRSTLDHMGTFYQVVVLAKDLTLPALDDGHKGLYQGIILATGNLGVCDPDCHSALSTSDWSRLDAYTAAFGVRTVSYYAYPEARYGLLFTDVAADPHTPVTADFTPEAAPVFPYLQRDSGLAIRSAFVYRAAVAPVAGERVVPILRLGDGIVGVLDTKPDGREYLALTFDQSPALRHSQLLNYGLVSWVTRGIFLGYRKLWLSPQVDDLFLANNLYTTAVGCSTTSFTLSPADPPAPDCPKQRMSADDLAALRARQLSWSAQPIAANFKTALAYNAYGASGGADDLVAAAGATTGDFFWISHTWDHRNLDCFAVLPGGTCRPVVYDEATSEIQQNASRADQLGYPDDATAMVTPALSGLTNRDFLQAAADLGIRYLVTDASRPEGLPAVPNTPVTTALNPDVIFVPRRATNIFFNAVRPETGVDGSQTDEYNFFFGPGGLTPYFTADQTYDQILENESDALLTFLLRYEMYPSMFHQSNLVAYDGAHSLYTDLIDRTFAKLGRLTNLPVVSLRESEIGRALEERTAWWSSGMTVTITPGDSIVIQSKTAATVPITGICSGQCETYGGDAQSKISVPADSATKVPLVGGPA
jgi:hypothetical protein